MEKNTNEREMMATRLEQFAMEYVRGEHIDNNEKAKMFWLKDIIPFKINRKGK